VLHLKRALLRGGVPQTAPDPDYSVLLFSAKSANYYHQLDNLSFAL
jgi:general stress protein 26